MVARARRRREPGTRLGQWRILDVGDPHVLGDAEPAFGAGDDITLGRYGFRWLRRMD
ncbi:MAG: hypothetical protein ABSB59_39425 [Streptosporangiaceae bacterium]